MGFIVEKAKEIIDSVDNSGAGNSVKPPFPALKKTVVTTSSDDAVQTAEKSVGEQESALAQSAYGDDPKQEVEMVDVQEYDPKSDEWVTKKVPIVTARGMIDRQMEMLPSNAFNTDAYDQNYHYYFASNRVDNPANIEARAKHYAPVRRAENAMHQVRKVEGFGEVVSVGDAVLFRVPRHVYEAQERDRLRRREAEKNEINPARREAVKLAEETDGVSIVENKMNNSYSKVSDVVSSADFDRALAEAEAYERAARSSQISPSTFGGFDGAYNKGAIPDSPYLRR